MYSGGIAIASAELLQSALALHGTDDAQDVLALGGELGSLAAALRIAAVACGEAAAALLPAPTPEHSVSDRYRHAAATWPVVPAPSYERLAGALAGLHEAADAARRAASGCDRVQGTLDAALAGRPRRGLRPRPDRFR